MFKFRMFDSVISQLGFKSERIVIFSKTYEGHYKISLNMFKEKPIFGHGTKMFRIKCTNAKYFSSEKRDGSNLGCSTHPHSYYLQILSETGVIGFLPFFSFYIFILYKFLRFKLSYFNYNFNYINSKIFIYGAILINFFPLIPSGNFFNNWISIIMYIPIGFFLYFEKHPNKTYLEKVF